MSDAMLAEVLCPVPQSDNELLAMHEGDYMNPAQLAFFEARLQRLREELLGEIRQVQDALLAGAERCSDELDQAAEEENRWMSLRIQERKAVLLRKVDAALKRIRDGDYGWCEDSGEPIGLKRLLARPAATLCVEAKQRREYREKALADA